MTYARHFGSPSIPKPEPPPPMAPVEEMAAEATSTRRSAAQRKGSHGGTVLTHPLGAPIYSQPLGA